MRRIDTISAAPAARDDRGVNTIAEQHDVGHVLRHHDEFHVHTSLDVDGEHLLTIGRGDGQRSQWCK